MKKKYWLMTIEFPPFYGGGIGTYSFNTARMLNENGYDCRVFVFDRSITNIIEEKINNINVVRFCFSGNNFYKDMGDAAKVSYEFAEIIKKYYEKEIPDFIEFHDYKAIGYFSLLRKFSLEKPFSKIKFITTVHAPEFITSYFNRDPSYKLSSYWTGEMEKFQLNSSDGVIFSSEYAKKEVEKHVKINNCNSVISYPFDRSILDHNEINILDKKTYLFIGKFVYLKGVFQLLEQFTHVWKKYPNAQLKMVGRDSFYGCKNKSIVNIIENKYKKELSEKKLILADAIPQNKVRQEMLTCKAVIISSLYETQPYTGLESMSLGCLLIASKTGGQIEIIKNKINGFLYDSNTESSLLNIIDYIEEQDQKSLLKIKNNAINTVLTINNSKKIFNQKIEFLEKINNSLKTRIYPFYWEKYKEYDLKEFSLTVIITFYNLGKYIEDTILSLIKAQEEFPFEIIVINDGSNDEYSVKKIAILEKKYNEIKFISKTNEGLAKTRNFGAKLAKTSLIAFLDADDKVDRKYYKKAVEIFKYYKNIAYVGSWLKSFGKFNRYWITWNPDTPYVLAHNLMNTSGLIFNKKIFLESGLNDPELDCGAEDYGSLIQLINSNHRGIVIPEPLFMYRTRQGSMSTEFNPINYIYSYQKIMEKNGELYKNNFNKLINILNSNGPGYLYDNPTHEYPYPSIQNLSVINGQIQINAYRQLVPLFIMHTKEKVRQYDYIFKLLKKFKKLLRK